MPGPESGSGRLTRTRPRESAATSPSRPSAGPCRPCDACRHTASSTRCRPTAGPCRPRGSRFPSRSSELRELHAPPLSRGWPRDRELSGGGRVIFSLTRCCVRFIAFGLRVTRPWGRELVGGSHARLSVAPSTDSPAPLGLLAAIRTGSVGIDPFIYAFIDAINPGRLIRRSRRGSRHRVSWQRLGQVLGDAPGVRQRPRQPRLHHV